MQKNKTNPVAPFLQRGKNYTQASRAWKPVRNKHVGYIFTLQRTGVLWRDSIQYAAITFKTETPDMSALCMRLLEFDFDLVSSRHERTREVEARQHFSLLFVSQCRNKSTKNIKDWRQVVVVKHMIGDMRCLEVQIHLAYSTSFFSLFPISLPFTVVSIKAPKRKKRYNIKYYGIQ